MKISEISRTAIQRILIGNQDLLIPFSEFCDQQALYWAECVMSELLRPEGEIDWQRAIRCAAKYDVWNNMVSVIEEGTKQPASEGRG